MKVFYYKNVLFIKRNIRINIRIKIFTFILILLLLFKKYLIKKIASKDFN